NEVGKMSLLPCCARLRIIFFFQAEDGIRAFHVTGVQTCALPISRRADAGGAAVPGGLPGPWRPGRAPRHVRRRAGDGPPPQRPRSEERRVGKECRSRWSRDNSMRELEQ